MVVTKIKFVLGALILSMAGLLHAGAREYHVATDGCDANAGTASEPLRSIQAAANLAMPGDTITVHEGVYRERVNPPRGGTSDDARIVYQAAPGARVLIKGSENVSGWQHVQHDTWKTVLPADFFGSFNPYADIIHGDWFNDRGRRHHTGAVYLDGHWLIEASDRDRVLAETMDEALWFAETDASQVTRIWAQFPGVNPNEAEVEINVRQTVFYPENPGVNYITVRGFIMEHAATPWAPPTAEQIGLIGTHWSKGWIIEDNVIRYSACTGITLGKYGDEFDNTSANAAEGYVQTINRALTNGWLPQNIGRHVVRNNHISHCEQAGIAGSLGAIFSTISGNKIHDIHVRRLFTGHEMAGIKIHAPIDCLISDNLIYDTVRGIWLDWMTQGTRVTRNVLYRNHMDDLFIEVNHGPFVVDHNILLSKTALRDWSQGGTYAHNLIHGSVEHAPQGRQTPFLRAHSTEIAGMSNIKGGDNRFINNLFTGGNGLAVYDAAHYPMLATGNVYLGGAVPYHGEEHGIHEQDFDSRVFLTESRERVQLRLVVDKAWVEQQTRRTVTSARLGHTRVSKLPFLHPQGTQYTIDTDYSGRLRDRELPFPGPFQIREGGQQRIVLWPPQWVDKIIHP